MKPVDCPAEIPIIDKRAGQVFAVSPSGIQIMDLETYEYIDAPLPDGEKVPKSKLVSGAEIEYSVILGRVMINRVK